ncbi:MAG: fibronectin type III domain-containing protein [Patescibacteria group bacterium]
MEFKHLPDLSRYQQIKIVSVVLVLFSLFLIRASPAFAATRYVNSDSSGAASNPTRAFDDPSYTANDSYATLTAAYTAASASDIIEFSGGSSGKSYVGHTASLQKANLTFRGSTISGHDGTVTINYNSGGGTYTMGLNANGMTVQRLTISRQGGTTGEYGLRVFLDNATITDVTIKNTTGLGISVELAADNTVFNNLRVDTSSIGGTSAMTVFNATTITNGIFSGVDLTGIAGISFQSSSGTSTLNNVIFDGVASGGVLVTTGTTVNLNNCVMTGGGISASRVIHFNSAGTVNTNNCFLQGSIKAPEIIQTGTGTWNSTNDVIGKFPYYTRSKENIGYIMFGTDDRHNLDYFKTIADYAKTNYGITMSFYVHDTANITASDKTKMQQLYLDGHEIAAHTVSHTNMGVTGPFTVTYTGAAVNIAFVVSSSGTSLSITGSADSQGPFDLSSAAYDTVGELCTAIEALTNYTCAMTGDADAPTKTFMPSSYLKDASTSLPQNTGTVIPYDDNTGASNRYMTGEITNCITAIESAMHENSATAAFAVKSFGYPYSQRTTFTSTWIKNNTSLTSIRSVPGDTLAEKTSLTDINLYAFHNIYNMDNIKGTGYDSLTSAEKKARIQQSARMMVTFASMGMVTGYTGHNETQDFTNEELTWLVDEVAVYKDAANVQVKTQSAIVNDIKTSGSWTDDGDGTWSRTFTGSANYLPRYQSQMINTGTTVSGRTTDIIGNSLVGTPDMGAYEFQAPAAPSSLAQYKSDGTTTIVSASQISDTTVVFKFTMSSTNSYDSLTPQVEIRTNSTAFTNVVTHSGTAVSYTGTPVTGTVTVTGLTSGSSYHWQASVLNAAATGSWTAMGGNPDFSIDSSPPTTPGDPHAVSGTNTEPTWEWTASTDDGGLANPAYTVQWSTSPNFSTIFGSSTTNNNYFTQPVPLSPGTWYFRVRSADNLGNNSNFSNIGAVVIYPLSLFANSKSTTSNVCTANPPKDAPAVVISSYGTNSVTLNWTPVDPVTHYVLYFKRNSDGAQYGVPKIDKTTSYTVNNLSGQESYTFELFGVNDCAPGPRGTVVSEKIDGNTISSPTRSADAIVTDDSSTVELFSIQVKVINEKNETVKDAVVNIPTAFASEKTDEDGIADFGNIPAGQQKITATANGLTAERSIFVDVTSVKTPFIIQLTANATPYPETASVTDTSNQTQGGSDNWPWWTYALGILLLFIILVGVYTKVKKGDVETAPRNTL